MTMRGLMTTRKLKVWCGDCNGTRERIHHLLGTLRACDTCGGHGYVEVEVLDLPDGRVVVVAEGVVGCVAAMMCDAAHEVSSDVPSWEESAGIPKKEWCGKAAAIIAALFTGKVYEAEAVGRLTLLPGDEPMVVLMPMVMPDKGGTAPEIEENTPIAVGLKEVGK